MKLLPLIIYITVVVFLFIVVITYEILTGIKGVIRRRKKKEFEGRFKSFKTDTEEEIIYVDTFKRKDTSNKKDEI